MIKLVLLTAVAVQRYRYMKVFRPARITPEAWGRNVSLRAARKRIK
jgi:hypothetical protein